MESTGVAAEQQPEPEAPPRHPPVQLGDDLLGTLGDAGREAQARSSFAASSRASRAPLRVPDRS
ncbi:hypothetical protein [Streptomyces sp. NPDC085479]|uniref:hypothetical protein n=1 Tax=Streptomyces sp. NPDC085479 TaxID=3365726 RepID=UPI0037D111DB